MGAKKKQSNELQLSLFEDYSLATIKEPETPSVLEFVKARFEHGPEMTQEEYKRWVKILVNNSLRRME